MRRLLTALVVAATTAVIPMLAMAGNQENADEIARSLRDSGQLKTPYNIGVKYQNGTAWLRGDVSSPEQSALAEQLVTKMGGVDRVVNNLTITGSDANDAAKAKAPAAARPAAPAPRVMAQPEAMKTPRPAAGAVRTSTTEPLPLNAPVPAARAATPAFAPMGVPMIAQNPVAVPAPQGVPAAAGAPMPTYTMGAGTGAVPVRYDQPAMPNYAWPSYAAYPNYAGVTYPRQYSPTAWPYIGPFYPYPQVPLGWRKVTLEWDDGWWMLNFKNHH